MNNGNRGNGRSVRGRNAIRKRQLGLSHLYAATTPIGGYGDRPMPIDEKCILRHVGGNVNGMIPINNDKGMTAMAGNLKGLQAGSLSMIETNVEWKHFQYRETTNQLLKKTFRGARVEFCTSDVSFKGRYKPGGTATAALGNWSHRVVGSGRDPTGCGRWSYVTYDGKGCKLITYVSVYIVCNQTNPGDTTEWRQQYQIQYSDESARVGSIDPHRQTMVDLEYFIRELRDVGHEVVVFLDANQNESRCYRPQTHDRKFKLDTGFNIDGTIDGYLKTFVENTGLHNILNTKHGDENVPPTRCPGSSVIAYVYVSEGLLEQVIGIGMLNFDAVFDNDHRTFFLDIDFESVFGTELDNMAAPQFRKLQLDDPRIAEGYGKIVHKLFTNHNIYKRVQNIAAR
jgi:hypothetical protein